MMKVEELRKKSVEDLDKELIELRKAQFTARMQVTTQQSNKTDQLLGTLINSRDCRHCKSQSYYKWGKESGIQRYKCRTCKRTFVTFETNGNEFKCCGGYR